MADEALAKAMEIAARLSGGLGIESSLGKRNIGELGSAAGLGSVQRKKIYIPAKEHPEINYLGLLIGPKGATQKHLQEVSGARVIIRGKGASRDGGPSSTNDPDDHDELHVSIEGNEESIVKAVREVEQILHDPEAANRLKSSQLGISMGGDGGSAPYQIELRIPNNMVGLVIGKGGENVMKIQNQLQVTITIQKEAEMQPGETLRQIILKGYEPAVREAKKRIDDAITTQMSKNAGLHSGGGSGDRGGGDRSGGYKELDSAFLVKLPVPNDKIGIIIGKGGMTIKGIQERSGAIVQIPPTPDVNDPSVRTLTIGGGSKETCDAAQVEIFMALQQQQQAAASQYNGAMEGTSVTVPDDKVGLIIGKGGATVKDMQNRLSVKLVIPQTIDEGTMPATRTLKIVGSEQNAAIAKYEVEMIVVGTPVHNPVAQQQALQAQQQAQAQAAQQAQTGYGAMTGMGGMGMQGYGMQGMGMYGQQAAAGMYGMQANPYGMMQGMYMDPYAASSTMNPYGAAMDPYAMMQQQQAAMYMQQQAATAAAAVAAAASTAAASTETPTDPTHYYPDFWKYTAYYGEAAARVYYGAWSPPAGIKDPSVAAVPVAVTAAPVTVYNSAPTVYSSAPVPVNVVPVSAVTPSGAATESVPMPANGEVAAAAPPASVNSDTAAAPTVEVADGSADPEADKQKWDAYQKSYSEWYENHGKASGADPNPPAM
jgi:far upstream element-binding protein